MVPALRPCVLVGGGLALLALSVSACLAQPATQVPDGVWVRDGYELSVAATLDQPARFLATDPDGTLYVSLPRPGQIRAFRDQDGDGFYEKSTVFVDDVPTAHAMQWHDGELWFTQTGAVRKARDTDGDQVADEIDTVLDEEQVYAGGGGHWWRSLLVHDGRIYTSVGDSGNITVDDGERQKIWSFSLDGSDKQLFASGLRNTEKLVTRPGTNEIWGMDHGSDWFGRPVGDSRQRQPITNLNPPDEMNHYVEGGFYGHPFIVGNKLPRYEFLERADIIELAAKTIPPAWPTGAHWASNAMTFYDAEQFPADVRGDAFVAYHGSWNREPKAGYQVTRVLFEDGRPYGELPYVTFLTKDDAVRGRPVDVHVANDGSLLISDDQGNRVYRLRYVGGQ